MKNLLSLPEHQAEMRRGIKILADTRLPIEYVSSRDVAHTGFTQGTVVARIDTVNLENKTYEYWHWVDLSNPSRIVRTDSVPALIQDGS